MFKKIKLFVKQHYLALTLALVVGFISVAPQFLYVIYLGNDYKGGYFFSTPNEDLYLSKMQEIIEGHWRVGSPVFFEYKDFKPLVPPVGEYLYALPSLIFNLPLTKVLVFSKFLFPAILFLLVYFFIYQLTIKKELAGSKINAAVGGLFVTLGYDLIDYKTSWLLLIGKMKTVNLLVWTRPVNPIIGALLIFALLLMVWSMINNRKKYLFIPAGLTLALMAGYFFSWGISLSIIGALLIIFIFKKDFFAVKQLGLTIFVALLASLPYWYNLCKSLFQSGNENLGAKNGLFYTHAPMINKFLLMISLIFLLIILYKFWKKENIKSGENNWCWFCLAMILGGWLAFNQQLVTGRTIWPYHFVQYTIPFSIIIGMIILGNFFRIKLFKVWVVAVTVILLSITAYNVRALAGYSEQYEAARSEQAYFGVINWLNKNAPKDCVVLVDDPAGYIGLKFTALTHCDTYLSNWIFEGATAGRIYHNYLVSLRLRGVKADRVKDYLLKNKADVKTYFFENWEQLFSLTADDKWLEAKIDQISLDYPKFNKQDFSQELKKYRLDYVVSEGELNKKTKDLLPELRFIDNLNSIYLYKF